MSPMRHRLLCLSPALALLLLAGLLLPPGGHSPHAVYAEVIDVRDAAWSWQEAEKGGIKGRLVFKRRRPKQPVVVYLVKDDGEGKFTVPDALKVSQKGARFKPSFAVLVRGQKVEFLNDEKEDISHNVYLLGAAELDLGIFARGKKRTQTFDKAGQVSVHCSIHKLMDARFFVAPSPAFAIVGATQTAFEIKNVPAGTYTLKTYQNRKRFKDASVKVTIAAGKTTVLTKKVEMKR